jgi:putative FmdB family regulatory protein
MPIYEYQCGVCKRIYGQLEPSNAPRTQSCIDCGGLAERVLSVPAKPSTGSSKSDESSYSPSTDCPLCKAGLPSLIIGIGIPIKVERRDISRN